MTDPSIFQVVQGLIFFVFFLHRGYYNRKFPPSQRDTVEEQEQSPLGTVANFLALPALLSLAAYVLAPRWVAWAALPLPPLSRWFGVLLALAGFGLLQWSHSALGRNWSDQPRITQSQTLTTAGPYRWIRHPIYTSFLAILGSSLLISANWLVGILWLLITAMDVFERMKFEEGRLRARFGEQYDAYHKRTGALLPKW